MNGPVICGIEDPSSAGAIEVAYQLAKRHDLPVLYVHVVDEDDVDAVRRLQHIGLYGNLAVERSPHPADRLIEMADERQASFLVVGNHGPRSSLLGSVSADVSRRAPCPVVVVPPTAAKPEPRRNGRPSKARSGGRA
jgi:universal stress protein family protein